MNDDQPVAPTVPAAPAAPVAQPQTPVAPAPVAPASLPVVQPQPASDRTREQFDKLVESNRRLFEEVGSLRTELTQRNQANQTFAPIQQVPAVPQQATPQVNPRDFVEVDPQTGEQFINEQKLQSRLNELNDKATRAEQTVNNYVQAAEQREIERQNREAFTAFPELNPDSQQFDRNFHNQTRAIIYDSLINPQDYNNRALQFKEAADLVRSQLIAAGQPAPAAPVEVQPQAGEAQAQAEELKQQAIADVTGQPGNQARTAVTDDEYLRQIRNATRRGDDEALAARLASIEHTGTPSGEA